MNVKGLLTKILLLLSCIMAIAPGGRGTFLIRTHEAGQQSPTIARITAEELKAKLAKNEPVTILDVRSTDSYVSSDNSIKGSIHVKLRRLHYRLSFPPLKAVARDSEVVTYCACPNDEASIRAAQILTDAGFKRVRVLDGGWQMWLRARGQVAPRPKA
jgi:rhodanese-related sulfurtransferase